jgi:hypothetical protein
MRNIRFLVLISLLLTLAIWGFFSWPLPRYFSSGIPSSAHNVELGNARSMIAGDHLQLHYFYWLFSDMLTGHTPFWYNLYEFNVGDDESRRQVGNYNMPFSFVYLIGRLIGGPAFAWNLTGLLTLWGTLLATWLLIRRLTSENLISLLCALLSITLPYRWITLLGGSPTGFAMLWVPLFFLGLHMAGRDNSSKGGFIAALALTLAYWNDPHTFFFSALFIPVGYLIGFLSRDNFSGSIRTGWIGVLRGLLPVMLSIFFLMLIGMAAKSAVFTGTNMADGRSVNEVLLFSPHHRGIMGLSANHVDDQIFIGYSLILLFVAHIAALPFVLAHCSKNFIFRHGLLVILLYGSIIAVVLMAMGPHSPFSTLMFSLPRQVLPGYNMIRQTGKIYAIMPVLLSIAAAVASIDLLRRLSHLRRSAVTAAFAGVVSISASVEYRMLIRPTVCLLDLQQPAYQAVLLDAAKDPDIQHAHALILPIWPGDSHWASLYQHYVSLYRIRMINGYSPIVSQAYREEIVDQFSSGNGGLLTDRQLDELLRRGIHYVIFHQDAYPERISAYPVGFALRRLVKHPRLELLQQAGSIRSFKIRPYALAHPEDHMLPDGPYFPSLRWNATQGHLDGGEWLTDESAPKYARMPTGARFGLRHPFNHMFAPSPHLWVRLRGQGLALFAFTLENDHVIQLQIDEDKWSWIPLPLPTHREDINLSITLLEGSIDLDMLTVVGGDWNQLVAGQSVFLKAGLFFSSGYTDSNGHVTLRPDYDPASVVFYGPRLPFEAGDYLVTLHYDSDAPAGTKLGYFTLHDGIRISERIYVIQGFDSIAEYRHHQNLPITLEFTFSRHANITIKGIDLQYNQPPAEHAEMATR